MKQIRHRLSIFVMALAVLLCAAVAGAQENAAITGTVTDPSGAAVPNATITITHIATRTVHADSSNGDGLYNFPGLQIGIYDLKVVAPGFKTYSKSGLVLNEAQTLRADVKLEVGSAAQTVTVQANVLQVQSETNEVSSLITGQQISQLATNGRNIISLTTMGTGVSNTMPAFNGVTAQGSNFDLSFNGMRPDHNNWLIDGGEVYDRGSGGKLDVNPSPDVLSEFQVLSSNYSPDYGIASGGTVLMEIKAGESKFHGGLWEFNRNDDFDAANYFSNLTNTPTPELRLNIYGGYIGGPVVIPHLYNSSRQKTFFFYSEEWRKYIAGTNPSLTTTVPANNFPTAGQPLVYTPFNSGAAPIVPVVPQNVAYTDLEEQDNLTPGAAFPNNTIPANMLDPNAVLFMGTGAIPQPNSGTDEFTGSPKQPTNVREDVVRIDHNISDKYHLMGSWIHDQMSQTIIPTQWSGDNYTTVGDVFANPTWGAVIKLTQTLSPSVVNETALDVNGNTINVTPEGIYSEPSGWNATSFFPGNNAENRLPQVSFGAPLNTSWTVIYWPWHNSFLDYQPRDDVSWTKGRHAMKFGFSYMRSDKNQQAQADTEGNYSFSQDDFSGDSYINFLLGLSQSFQQLQSQFTDHWINNTYSFYGNDNWHISPRLTVEIGLRYDVMPHVYEKNNHVSNFVPADFTAANSQVPSVTTGDLDPTGPGFSTVNGEAFYLDGIQPAGQNGFPQGLVKNSYNTIQPRVGFSYDLFGNGKTVLRGGSGVFFERVQGNDIYNLDTNVPFAYNPSASNVFFSNPGTSVTTGASAAIPTPPAGLEDIDYYYPNPGTLQFSLGVQHELAPSVVAAIQYVGTGAWDQDDLRELNDLPLSDLTDREAVATSGANANLYRPFSGYSNIVQEETRTNSSYNSMQAALRMENRHGLTLQLAYTWSHEIDIQSADETTATLQGSGGDISDPFDYAYDRGSGNFDRRNIFNVNYIYNLPFFLHADSAIVRSALGGWQFAGITVAQSGTPVNIYYNGPDTLGLGGNTTNRPDEVSPVSYPKTQTQWFSTSSFANPVAPWAGGTSQGFGDARKDAVVGPGLFNWNMSLYKDFPLTSHEGPHLQFRVESYNTFNHTEFDGIDTGTGDSNYGKVTSAFDPRVLQFGAKFLF